MPIEQSLTRIAEALERIALAMDGGGQQAALPLVAQSYPDPQSPAGKRITVTTPAPLVLNVPGFLDAAPVSAPVPSTPADPMAGFVQGGPAAPAAAPTEPEAPKRGRGRPPSKAANGAAGAPTPAAPPAAVPPPSDASPAPAKTEQVPSAALKGNASQDDMRHFLTTNARKKGMLKVQGVIKSFGVESVMSLKPEQYADLRAKVEALP